MLDGVAGLVDKSLLRQETQADGEPRLLMLETIREYALERLKASGEVEALRRRQTTFFLALSEETYPKMQSAERSTWRSRLGDRVRQPAGSATLDAGEPGSRDGLATGGSAAWALAPSLT